MKYVRDFAVRIGMTMILTIFAIPAFAETPITSCPFNITAPGNYILNADLTCVGGGITITASNVSLKLNGHKITVPIGGPGGVIAINVNGDPVGRVHHVGIQGPGLITSPPPKGTLLTGIALRFADYSQVSQVTVVGAAAIDAGITTSSSTFLTLTSNVIGQSGNGLLILSTSSSSMSGNDVSGNIYDGIYMSGGSGNTINNNIANGNSGGIGIVFNAAARVYGNVTNGNSEYGIYTFSAISQAFSNTAKANGQFDLFDYDACGGSWSDNVFLTANARCIR